MRPLNERTTRAGAGRVPGPLRRLYAAHSAPRGVQAPVVHVHLGPSYNETGEVLVWAVGTGATYDRTRVHTLVHRPDPAPGQPRWEYVTRTPKQRAPRAHAFGWYAVQNWADACGLDASLIDLDLEDVLSEPQ